MKSYQSCIFFLADGARPDILEEKLGRGELPNIARYMVEPGAYRRATTVFPSTTGPAYMPFLTGCYPGRCNVPGIRWFDRAEYARTIFSWKRFRSYVGPGSSLQNHDLASGIRTLFEIADRPINVFSSINKGSGFKGNRTKWDRMLYLYYAHLTDRWQFVDQASTRKLIRALDSQPDFVFAVLPAIDEYSHLSNPFSQETSRAYNEMDRLIGLVVDKLKSQGRLEGTLMMIGSDHGLSTTTQHFGVDTFLEKQKGIKTFFYPLIFKTNFKAATMVSGNGMCHVYWRGKAWNEKVTFEDLWEGDDRLPQSLVEQEAVDFVAGRGRNGNIVVYSQKGKAQVSRHNGTFSYHADEGDALGLKHLSAKKLTSEESLAATFDSDYPDALVQLMQIFDSPRTGELVISAKPGFDLRDRFESPEHRGSHGSLHREHIHVPFVCSAPLKAGPLRTVDAFPTILSYLNRDPVEPIDGINRRES